MRRWLNAYELSMLKALLTMSPEQRRKFAAEHEAASGARWTEGRLWSVVSQLAGAVCGVEPVYAVGADAALEYVDAFESHYGKQYLLDVVDKAMAFVAARDAFIAITDKRPEPVPDWVIEPRLLGERAA